MNAVPDVQRLDRAVRPAAEGNAEVPHRLPGVRRFRPLGPDPVGEPVPVALDEHRLDVAHNSCRQHALHQGPGENLGVDHPVAGVRPGMAPLRLLHRRHEQLRSRIADAMAAHLIAQRVLLYNHRNERIPLVHENAPGGRIIAVGRLERRRPAAQRAVGKQLRLPVPVPLVTGAGDDPIPGGSFRPGARYHLHHPHRRFRLRRPEQVSGLVEPARRPVDVVGMHLRNAVAQRLRHGRAQQRPPPLMPHVGNQLLNQLLRPFPEHARRLACNGIAVDPAAFRVGRLLCNARRPQCRRIDDGNMIAVPLQINGMFGGDFIQVDARWLPLFHPAVLVPATSDDPAAGRFSSHPLGNGAPDRPQALQASHGQRVQRHGVLKNMEVCIGQPGQHGPPFQLDDAGRRTMRGQHLRFTAEGNDFSAGQRQRFRRFPAVVRRQHGAACENPFRLHGSAPLLVAPNSSPQ
jgi:hypothetical protein